MSELDSNETVEELRKSELGFLLIEANVKNVYDALCEGTTWEDRLGICADDSDITYHLFPLFYQKKCGFSETLLADSRRNAIRNLFVRWGDAGFNKNRAKSPFSSKGFQKFLEEIEFGKADYLLFMVDG